MVRWHYYAFNRELNLVCKQIDRTDTIWTPKYSGRVYEQLLFDVEDELWYTTVDCDRMAQNEIGYESFAVVV